MSVRRIQSGYVLLLVLLALMGIGGVVLAGITQQAKQEQEVRRYEHNQRVLREAKQALLMYAYNYPDIALVEYGTIRGPGRLPCPDTDDPTGAPPNVVVDGVPNATPECEVGGIAAVGRFPFDAPGMNFYEALDASGEHLWYAVSSEFANNQFVTDTVNSNTSGTITLVDQSGSILYNGAASGLAAVIIAPGPVLRRDEDNNGSYEITQKRDDNTKRGDPKNYLDTFSGFDNSTFANGSSAAADSFIVGPIFDINEGDYVVNDQVVIVTADEVVEMAERKVLEVYRDAIAEYLELTLNGDPVNNYPWLYNYSVGTAAELDGSFPAYNSFATEIGNELTNFGRVPSMFGPYFTADVGVNDIESIESKISVQITNSDFMGNITYNRSVPSALTGNYLFVNNIWNGSPTIDGPADININIETAPVTNLRFVDDAAPDRLKLVGTIAADETYPFGPFWFWSRNDFPYPTEWAKCRSVHLVDCHVDAGYIPDPHGPGQQSIQILRVEGELFFDSSAADLVEFTFDLASFDPDPVAGDISISPATNTGHAWIEASFSAADIPGSMIELRYEWDDNYTDGNYDVDESGTLAFSSMGATMEIGLRFYPVLPNWVFDNSWHNSVMMAYADTYRHDVGPGGCTPGSDCLVIDNTVLPGDNKASLLVIAGEHDWGDDGDLSDDVDRVFDIENADFASDSLFDARPSGGNDSQSDKLLVIEEN